MAKWRALGQPVQPEFSVRPAYSSSCTRKTASLSEACLAGRPIVG